MTDYQSLKEAPFANIDYFVPWGSRPWQRFVEIGLKDYMGGNLENMDVLEIGPGNGLLSCLLASLGAKVTSLEIDPKRLLSIKTNIQKFGFSDKIEPILYDGNPDVLGDRQFDLLFSKSALIYVNDFKSYLENLDNHLKPGGRFVFIENVRGNLIFQLLRFIKRRSLSFFRRTHFFDKYNIEILREVFKIELLMHSKFPPICLICGQKK
ncbi:MAG: methyltransferase domain-containing protein [candidate division Zixibacteria bacterium]|nr:methyltransferase domain-containing protein [candidate division Zixibacteria bacterium]